MDMTRLGRTNLLVSRTAFGALPIQRDDMETSVRILRKAYDNGINFFDTARGYSDSEEKIGKAFSEAGLRDKVVIATKTGAKTHDEIMAQLELSLQKLQTDHIDIYQFHNPDRPPMPGDGSGMYEAMLEARQAGKIRFISASFHAWDCAMNAAKSGLYDSVQYPFSVLSNERDIELVNCCKTEDVGFIAMKALSGGLIRSAKATFSFIRQFENVVPIYGIQHEWELDEFLEYSKNPPMMNDELQELIDRERSELTGEFCRGCAYCLRDAPCPADIPINLAMRMVELIKRSPGTNFLSEDFKGRMDNINNCLECNQCSAACPYGLDVPAILKKQYAGYVELYNNRVK